MKALLNKQTHTKKKTLKNNEGRNFCSSLLLTNFEQLAQNFKTYTIYIQDDS